MLSGQRSKTQKYRGVFCIRLSIIPGIATKTGDNP